jgi:hypothetical protein
MSENEHFPEFLEQYERNLLKACQDLHMNITGSSKK